MDFAGANGFELGPAAATYAAQIAANKIQNQSFNDAAREAGVQTAIAELPRVATEVRSATAQTSFPDAASVRALMAAKLCDCPWPWGNGS
jgi:hypothetical protein